MVVELKADALRVYILGKDYKKGDVFAQKIGNGYRFYSNDPLYPITPWVGVHNAVDGSGDPFANIGALDAWVADNVNVTSYPAPPASGTFVLTSTDGVLSWEGAS